MRAGAAVAAALGFLLILSSCSPGPRAKAGRGIDSPAAARTALDQASFLGSARPAVSRHPCKKPRLIVA